MAVAWDIERTLARCLVPERGTLGVIHCTDGYLRIIYDNEPLEGLIWPRNRLKECIDAFLTLMAQSREAAPIR